jgi:hypothetical protein
VANTAQPRPTGVYFMIQNAVTFVNEQGHEAVYVSTLTRVNQLLSSSVRFIYYKVQLSPNSALMECVLIRCCKMVCIFVMTAVVVLAHASIPLNMRTDEQMELRAPVYTTHALWRSVRKSSVAAICTMYRATFTSSRSDRACSV